MPEEEKRMKTRSGYLSNLIIVLLLIALVWLGWNYYQKQGSGAAVALPTGGDQTAPVDDSAEIAALVKQFSKMVLLPAGEPRLLTISNAAALATEQAFFIGSQNGDKVLVYVEAKKAYVLSPSRNLVINVGPVIDEEAKAEEITGSSTDPR